MKENEQLEKSPLLTGKNNNTIQYQSLAQIEPPSPINSDSGPLPAEDILSSLTHYYLVSQHSQDIKYNVGKYVLLTTISGTSIWLFGTTGGLVAGNDLVLKFLLISGGTVLNFCTTFNTAEAFIDYIKNNRIPAELKKLLKSKSNKLELIAIGGAAFLSAGPITLAVFSNTEKITSLVITEAVITQIDNSFIHTFPTLLLARTPALRKLFSLPFFPIILSYQLYKSIEQHCLTSETEMQLRQRQEKKQQSHALIKSAMIDTLESARQQIVNRSFRFDWNCRKPWQSQYTINLPSNLKNIAELNDIEPLLQIAAYAPRIQEVPQPALSAKIRDFFVDTVIGGSFYLFGTALSNLGAAGFYKNAFDDSIVVGNHTHAYFSHESKDFSTAEAQAWGWGLSTPPNILTAVLVGYFAGRFFKHTVYDSFISTLKGQYTAPQGFKRYPKTTTLLIGLAFFLAKYGYGTALYLDQTHFQDAKFDSIRPVLLLTAKYGVPVFLFKNTIEFILNQTVKYASFFGNDDNKASAELDAKILALENAIQHADGDKLEESLKNRTEEQRKALLRMSEDEFNQLFEHSTDAQEQEETRVLLPD